MQRSTRAAFATVAMTLAFAPVAPAPDPNRVSQKLRDDVTVGGIVPTSRPCRTSRR